MLQDASDIVEYILNRYPGAKKVVEVGIGMDDSVYRELKLQGLTVVATDIEPIEHVVIDDILTPKMAIYGGVGLIYSIRPNPELIEPLRKIAEEVGASLIIRPLNTDASHKPTDMKLVNYKKAVLWTEP